MTKAELIRKIAKRTGVPDSEAKYFFELFLMKAASQLKPGETVKLKSLGYFQLRTGRIKNEDIKSEIMIFYPISSEYGDNSESMIFNIPLHNEPKFNPIDTYFSLSFGRPVIPLHNSNNSEYFLPPTGAELRKLSETKSEKLLQEIELVDNFSKGNEELILNPESSIDSQMEIDWEDIQVRTKTESGKDQGSIAWDFGDLDKEIEEESLLDTGNDDNLVQNYEELDKENLNWDFGENLQSEPAEDKIKEEEPKEKKLNFEQVKSITSDFNLREEEESWDFGNKENHKQTISDEINEDGFAEIKSYKQRFPFVTDLSEYTEEEKEISSGDILENENPVEDEQDKEIIKDSDDIVLPPPSEIFEEEIIKETESESKGYGKRKGIGFYLLFAILALIGIGYYGYVKLIKKPAVLQTKIQYRNPKTAPYDKIIERNYQLPVTYPYLITNKLSEPFNPYNLPKEVKEQNQIPPVKNDSDQQNQMNSESAQKVKEFFYKQGDKYFVQISAWQNKYRAERHAQMLRDLGFTTEIHKVNLSDEIWYRVRAGYFNTLEEAQNFYNKYR